MYINSNISCMWDQKINLSFIWGGKWVLNVLGGLRKYPEFNLAALIGMTDSWGSAGVIRREFKMLPPGDIRRAVIALSDDPEFMRKFFQYRFGKWNTFEGHTVGNIILTAMSEIMWDFEAWIDKTCELFWVKWHVLPMTTDISHLCVELENGEIIKEEEHINEPKHDPNLAIKRAFLEPVSQINPKAESVIENSDIVVIWPWDLYTSVICSLLVDWVAESLRKSKAKKVFFCNIMTKHWETNNYWVKEFVEAIEKYIWEWVLDYVVVNSWYISDDLVENYEAKESKKPVKLKDKSFGEGKSYKIIERDLIDQTDVVRHSPEKIAKVINDIKDWWIR